MARSSNWFVVVSAVIGLVVVYFIYTLSSSSEYTEFGTPYNLKDATTLQHRCVWQQGDPVIYHLRTKLGVNYDAGHWFHMAENFMVQRSILRQAKLLTNSSHVLYSFDKEGFIKDLNGITRLMVYQGTHCSLTSPEKLYYLHMTALPWEQARARVGSSVVIDRHTIDELQVADLSGPVSVSTTNGTQQSHQALNRVGVPSGALTSRRFSTVAKYHRWPSHELEGKHDSGTTTAVAGAGAEGSGGNREASSLRRTLVTASGAVTATASAAAGASVTQLGANVVASSHAVRHNSHTQICAKYMGTIGGDWPTVQRGHWFPNAGDIESFRDSLRRACPKDPTTLETTAKKKPFKMVIYQRDLSRKLANEAEALAQLQGSLGDDWEIQVLMHSGSRSPCMLAHHLSDADILVTPHGFQSMLLLFLPRPALIFEIFPYRYYKRGYGPFGGEYGVTHGGVMSPPTTWQTSLVLPFITTASCMGSKFCRNFARSQDVILTPHGVSRLVAFVKENHAQLAQQPAERDFLY